MPSTRAVVTSGFLPSGAPSGGGAPGSLGGVVVCAVCVLVVAGSLPPVQHAGLASARPANTAARENAPIGTSGGSAGSSAAAQNGHAVAATTTWRRQLGHGRRSSITH